MVNFVLEAAAFHGDLCQSDIQNNGCDSAIVAVLTKAGFTVHGKP